MNIAKMMKQAQQMQKQMGEVQEKLAAEEVEASVGGGKVTVTATGGGDVIGIKIDKSVIDPEDTEFLEELILSGVQAAIAKGRERAEGEMKKVTGGMGLPGMGF